MSGAGGSVTAIRVEGPRPSVEYRCDALRRLLAAQGATEELHGRNSALFWQALRDVAPFAAAGDARCVWRISVPPKDGPQVMQRLTAGTGGEAYLDWGGGLIWLGPTANVILGVAIIVISVFVVSMFMATLTGIFRTALYIFATTGQVPAPYDQAQVTGAFTPKRGFLR